MDTLPMPETPLPSPIQPMRRLDSVSPTAALGEADTEEDSPMEEGAEEEALEDDMCVETVDHESDVVEITTDDDDENGSRPTDDQIIESQWRLAEQEAQVASMYKTGTQNSADSSDLQPPAKKQKKEESVHEGSGMMDESQTFAERDDYQNLQKGLNSDEEGVGEKNAFKVRLLVVCFSRFQVWVKKCIVQYVIILFKLH